MRSPVEKNHSLFSFLAFLTFVGFFHHLAGFHISHYENLESRQAHYKQAEFHSFHYYKSAVNENEEKNQEEKDIKNHKKVFTHIFFSTVFIPHRVSLVSSVGIPSSRLSEATFYGLQLRIFIHSLCV